MHSDICDFHITTTLGRKTYIGNIYVDDFSEYCYVYLLHSKDEVKEMFETYYDLLRIF